MVHVMWYFAISFCTVYNMSVSSSLPPRCMQADRNKRSPEASGTVVKSQNPASVSKGGTSDVPENGAAKPYESDGTDSDDD